MPGDEQQTSDEQLAAEEADVIPASDTWDLPYADDTAFEDALAATIEQHRPELLLWWFPKDDRRPGLIAYLRQQYPWCRTVTRYPMHTLKHLPQALLY